jgi:hypothetical protein
VARIALATGASVIPTGIWGTQSRWPESGLTWRRPLRPCVALAYGSAVPTAGDVGSPEDVNAFTERVMRAIEEQVVIARRVAEGRG